MSGGMPVSSEPFGPPGYGGAMPPAQAQPTARRLAWIGAIVALAGAGIAVGVVLMLWTFSQGVTAGTPEAAVYEALLFTSYAAEAMVGVGIFLAALGFAFRGPRRNGWFLLGGLFVLVGAVGAAAMQSYIQSLFFSGNFPGIAAIQNLSIAEAFFSLMDPLGIALILLGFVLPRGASWMG